MHTIKNTVLQAVRTMLRFSKTVHTKTWFKTLNPNLLEFQKMSAILLCKLNKIAHANGGSAADNLLRLQHK